MSAEIPTTEPTRIVAGDSVEWTKTIPDYPADLGWILSYVMMCAGVSPTTITSTASGSDHAVSVPAATTAAFAAGTYHWTSMVTNGSERKTISSRVWEVLPNPATATSSTDLRTHAEKCLAAIEAVIEGRMSDPIVEYQIGTRMAKKIPHTELLKLRTHYRSEVRSDRGLPRSVCIPVRFRNV